MNIYPEYTVKTKIFDRCIAQTVLHKGINNYVEIISRQVVDTQEKQFKSALIKLGWTPPEKG